MEMVKAFSREVKMEAYFNGVIEGIVSPNGGNEDGSHGVVPDEGNNWRRLGKIMWRRWRDKEGRRGLEEV